MKPQTKPKPGPSRTGGKEPTFTVVGKQTGPITAKTAGTLDFGGLVKTAAENKKTRKLA